MDFEDSIHNLIKKLAKIDSNIIEQQTKDYLIQPFIRALGYDTSNPDDVIPEFTASTGNLKDARADYALVKDGKAFAVIECKQLNTNLDAHKSQLEWYFHNSTARIGILTNGDRYIFYSDLEEKHVMDAIPYLDFSLSKFDDSLISRIRLLCKDKFNEDEYLKIARQSKYIREFKKHLDSQFENPDDEFAKLFISNIWTGKKITQNVLDKFKPILKQALDQYISDKINSKLKDLIKHTNYDEGEVHIAESNEQPSALEIDHVYNEKNGLIVTTKEEIEALDIVKNILKDVNPERISLQDRVAYCNIILDNKQKSIIVRLYFNHKPWRILIFDSLKVENSQKIDIETVHDLYKYSDRIVLSFQKYTQNKESAV